MKKINEIIEELSKTYIGKHGVMAIWEEVRGKSIIIKFLLSGKKINSEKLPKIYEGYKIEFEESDKIIPHTN